MSEAWKQWEGQVIDGRFELKQYLSSSGQSAVFLTRISPRDGQPAESGGPEAVQLAIKLTAADPAHAAHQLSRWRLAQLLSHPNLLRVFDAGSCRLNDKDVIFGVMEYAEENLAQIIPERPLTIDETRQMVEPTLNALAYLHGQGLVHGCLTPAHVMAMGDQIKLASDSISPITEAMADAGAAGAYDAPEAASGTRSAASDVWSLGMLLSEVLTQRLPVQNGSQGSAADPRLPENFPAPFLEIARGCLRRDPDLRWTVAGIMSWLHPEASFEPTPAVDGPEPATAEAGEDKTNLPTEKLASQRYTMAQPTMPPARMPAVSPESPGPQELVVASAPATSSPSEASPAASGPAANQRVSTRSLQQPPARVATKSPASSAPLDFLSWTVPVIRRFAVPAIVALAALAALYASFGLLHRESTTASPADVPAAKTAQQSAPPQKPRPSSSRTDAKPSPRIRASSTDNRTRSAPSVLPSPVSAGPNNNQDLGVTQQVTPAASRSALATIWGTVRVSVKIKVDSAGNTTGIELATPGPSTYFGRLSRQAAQEWKFDRSQAGRSFLLHFEFRNSGVQAYATRAGA